MVVEGRVEFRFRAQERCGWIITNGYMDVLKSFDEDIFFVEYVAKAEFVP